MSDPPILAFILAVVMAKPITGLVHELGHGVTALLLTRKRVTLYVGSYGERKRSFRLTLGRLRVYFSYNPLRWEIGMCVPETEGLSFRGHAMITLMGPLASLFLAAACVWVLFSSDLGRFSALAAAGCTGAGLWDFFVNIIPKTKPVAKFQGASVYNDGQQLRIFSKYRKVSAEIALAV
jgi:hypothetical protein